MGNASQLRELFQDLIANAVKYRRAEESPQIHIGALKQGRESLFALEDNGQGSTRNMRIKYSAFSRVCTARTCSAPVSAWPFARRSWSGTAGASGPSLAWDKARPSISHYPTRNVEGTAEYRRSHGFPACENCGGGSAVGRWTLYRTVPAVGR
jgi:hypothetical protein